jgi:carbamoyl-phosphate synthase large subunit
MDTLLITGVGAIIGYGLVRGARKSRYPLRVVGMDTFDDAAGQHWCDEFVQAVPAASPEYLPFIRDLIQRRGITLVLPGVEYDAFRMSRERDAFADLQAKFVLNDAETIRIASDKWLTHCRLAEAGIPAIPTRIDGTFDELAAQLGLPFLFKPRRLSASKGIQAVSTETEFQFVLKRYPDNFLVQRIVGDDSIEYTVGVFGYGDGTYSHPLAMQRRLSREGATAKARTVVVPRLENRVSELVRLFRPMGTTNLQFRLHENEFLLLELNPRFSSSESLRTAFGINDVELCIEYYLQQRKPLPRAIRPGRAVRYIDDLVTYDDRGD